MLTIKKPAEDIKLTPPPHAGTKAEKEIRLFPSTQAIATYDSKPSGDVTVILLILFILI